MTQIDFGDFGRDEYAFGKMIDNTRYAAVRRATDDEHETTFRAIQNINEHRQSLKIEIVQDAAENVLHGISEPPPGIGFGSSPADDPFMLRFLSWLLIWRLYLDHCTATIGSRFALEPTVKSQFQHAKSRAYDASPAYRLAEALRNWAQHRGLPPIARSIREDGRGGGWKVAGTNIRVQALLAWKKCPATVRKDLTGGPDLIDVPSLVEDAMSALALVETDYNHLIETSLVGPIAILTPLIAEAAPDWPCYLRLNSGKPHVVNINQFNDVVEWLNSRADACTT